MVDGVPTREDDGTMLQEVDPFLSEIPCWNGFHVDKGAKVHLKAVFLGQFVKGGLFIARLWL